MWIRCYGASVVNIDKTVLVCLQLCSLAFLLATSNSWGPRPTFSKAWTAFCLWHRQMTSPLWIMVQPIIHVIGKRFTFFLLLCKLLNHYGYGPSSWGWPTSLFVCVCFCVCVCVCVFIPFGGGCMLSVFRCDKIFTLNVFCTFGFGHNSILGLFRNSTDWMTFFQIHLVIRAGLKSTTNPLSYFRG